MEKKSSESTNDSKRKLDWDKIDLLQEKHALNDKKLAKLAGVSTETLRRARQGEFERETVAKLAEALNVTPFELYTVEYQRYLASQTKIVDTPLPTPSPAQPLGGGDIQDHNPRPPDLPGVDSPNLVFVVRDHLRPDPHLVGRKTLLDGVSAQLRSQSQLVLSGPHGVGKTTLVRWYAELHRGEYRDILWVPADGSLPVNFQRLGRNAGWVREPSASADHDADLVMQTLLGPVRRLLILDGASSEESVRGWVPYGGGCDTLITTCFTNWSDMPEVPVNELVPDDAVAYLIRRGGRLDNETERKSARLLADRLGRLPLALKVAATYVRDVKIPFDEYSRLVSHGPRSPVGKYDVLGPSIDRVGPLARAIFRAAAYLAVDAVPVRLLMAVRERLGAAAATLEWTAGGRPPTEIEVREALAELQRYSLGTYDKTTLAVHSLLREVQVGRLGPGEAPTWQGLAVAILNAAFPDGTEDPAAWLEYAPVVGGIDPGDERLASAPALELAMLHFNLGNLHRKMMSDLDRAKVYFDNGFEKHWNRADPPPRAKMASRVRRYYGDLLRLLGEVEGARTAYRIAVGYEQMEPAERGKVLSSVAELCARYATEPGHLDEALAAAQESLGCQLQAGEPFELFQSHRVLADVHVSRGEPDATLGHVAEAKDFLDRVAKSKGLPQWDRHPHAGWLLRTEGEAHQLRGEHAAARERFRAARDVFYHYGHSAGQAVALKKIASAEFGLGNTPEAIRCLDEALQKSAPLRGERYLRAVILLARVHAGRRSAGPELAPLLDEARELLADATGAPTELGRVLVRRTQAGFRGNPPTTLAAFFSELREDCV